MHISETGRKGVSGSIKGGVGANGLSEAGPVRLTGLSSERADSQMSVSWQSGVESCGLAEGAVVPQPHAGATLPGHTENDGHIGHKGACPSGGALREEGRKGREGQCPVHWGPDGGMALLVLLSLFVFAIRCERGDGEGLGQEGS